MNFIVSPLRENAVNLMRRAGYTFQRHTDRPSEMSFVRALGSGGYPRFHLYATTSGMDLNVSIHIDHKPHTYGNATRHHGEYDDSGALGPEVLRLKTMFGVSE
ncbi:MAG: hypothetical protein KC736_01910 [Candidatus Moranbacteria bacterium]|nr:hypothetical protein [Candidatus Moranbacteria bacterium]